MSKKDKMCRQNDISYFKLAYDITLAAGGKSNIMSAMHCVTRVMLCLKNPNLADKKLLQGNRKIKGIIYANQMWQAVIGKDADKICYYIKEMLNLKLDVSKPKRFNIFKKIKIFKSAVKSPHQKTKDVLLSPIRGRVITLDKTEDILFSKEVFGKGVAIIPEISLLVSPCDGTVQNIPKGQNAVTIISDNKTEILLHIGTDTANLKGKNFISFVHENKHVKVGDPLIAFDSKKLLSLGYDLTVYMTVVNHTDFSHIKLLNDYASDQAPLIKVLSYCDN